MPIRGLPKEVTMKKVLLLSTILAVGLSSTAHAYGSFSRSFSSRSYSTMRMTTPRISTPRTYSTPRITTPKTYTAPQIAKPSTAPSSSSSSWSWLPWLFLFGSMDSGDDVKKENRK